MKFAFAVIGIVFAVVLIFHYKDGTLHATKRDAEASEEHFDSVTTE